MEHGSGRAQRKTRGQRHLGRRGGAAGILFPSSGRPGGVGAPPPALGALIYLPRDGGLLSASLNCLRTFSTLGSATART